MPSQSPVTNPPLFLSQTNAPAVKIILKTYNVAQCSQFLAAAIQKSYIFKNITIRGTLSGVHTHFSGVTFFSLYDGNHRISCFIGRMHHAFLTRKLESGLEASCVGDLRYDSRMGRPVLYVNRVLAVGQSEWKEQQDAMVSELERRGYFEPSRKKPLPRFPFHIGIVTSGSGAVIHDILRTGRMRNPFVRYSLYNSAVQGEGAAQDIAQVIASISQKSDVPDVLIIARGGGAEEDLSTFNEKILLEAVHDCPIPTISAVGHETDTPLIDLVADVRASTPTQAAEIAIPEKAQVLGQIEKEVRTMTDQVEQVLCRNRNAVFLVLPWLAASLTGPSMESRKKEIHSLCLDMRNQVQKVVSDGYRETGHHMLQLLQQEKRVYHE